MFDFRFKKLCDPDPVEEHGRCRISGELLNQLKALETGKCLRLTGEDGREYGIVLWDDMGKRVSESEGR